MALDASLSSGVVRKPSFRAQKQNEGGLDFLVDSTESPTYIPLAHISSLFISVNHGL